MISISKEEIETVVKEVALQSLKHNYNWVADHLDLSDEALLPVVKYLCKEMGEDLFHTTLEMSVRSGRNWK